LLTSTRIDAGSGRDALINALFDSQTVGTSVTDSGESTKQTFFARLDANVGHMLKVIGHQFWKFDFPKDRVPMAICAFGHC